MEQEEKLNVASSRGQDKNLTLWDLPVEMIQEICKWMELDDLWKFSLLDETNEIVTSSPTWKLAGENILKVALDRELEAVGWELMRKVQYREYPYDYEQYFRVLQNKKKNSCLLSLYDMVQEYHFKS